ncbi:MAG TPA: DUF2628 domain-containing protein [Hyphomicrobiaceae bacterium]|nr:DUF2628 domain-containing protein [Hyphomicrobiaceae bacterium]
MLTFTVHEPPDAPADRIDRAERLVFVKDGFSWAAAVFGPLWMIFHRLWWALLGFVLITGGLQLIGKFTAADQRWLGLATFAINVLVGFEADALQRWALERRGWRMLGAVSGRNLAECERRFFEAWLPAQPILTPSAPSRPMNGGLLGGWRRSFGALRGARS